MNQRLAIIIFAFAFVVAIVAGFYSPGGEVKPTPSDFRAKLRENLPIGPRSGTPKAKPAGTESSKREPAAPAARLAPALDPTKGPGLDREQFTRKYGDALRITPASGRATRIDGIGADPSTLEGSARVPGFRPSSADDLRARAEEILKDAHRILGLNASQEWVGPTIQPGESSGQVIFQLAVGGVPVYPDGLITLVIGAEGELRSMDSSAYPETRVMNARTLGAPANSRAILYVTDSEPVAALHHAYETRDAGGIQRVSDAQTGEVLLERDRKIK
jgi:hypothetical protein